MKKILSFLISSTIIFSCETPYQEQERKQATYKHYKDSADLANLHIDTTFNKNFVQVCEISYKPNEKSVSRYYSVFVVGFDSTNSKYWSNMYKYAKTKPYDGYTVVWFWDSKVNATTANSFEEFDKIIEHRLTTGAGKKHIVAGYWHYPNGSDSFQKYPARDE